MQIRQKINHIVHPLVYDICQKKINLSKDKVIFLSVPLLFEAGFEKLCDEIWCVYTNSEVQLDRLMKRNHLAQEEAEKMIQSQMPLDEKCQKATFIIDNSDELCYTIEQIQKILK